MPENTELRSDAVARASAVAPHRLLALTDGVIAIAMTLLALDLKPDLPPPPTSGHLAHYLGDHVGQYAAFAIAFALIAQYWISHHRVMRGVHTITPRLVRETMLFLFAITLVPLTTFLTGNYGNSLAVTIFAANVFLVGLALGVMGETIRRRTLDDTTEDRGERIRRRSRSIGVLVIPALVAGLAWAIGSQAAWLYFLFYVVDVPGTFVSRRVATDG